MNHSDMQNLLDRYLSGACSAEEQLIIEKWLEQQHHVNNEWSQMDTSAKAAWMADLRQDLRQTISSRASISLESVADPNILPMFSETSKSTLPLYRRLSLRVAVAAAIILLAGTGAWWFLHRPYDRPVVAAIHSRPVNDVQPGGNKAILTLANGSTIILDSVANGSLAQQGRTAVLKTANGQLAYTPERTKTTEVLYNMLTTPKGGQYQLVLPDGSKVWLNAASSIRYPTVFVGRERKVTITGEAYFEIKENAAMPFVVATTNKGEIKVLGTQFNVNAYDDEPVVKTTLLEGSVLVEKDAAKALLRPRQQAQLTKAGSLSIIKDADIEETVAWKNGKFSCRNMGLEDIMRQVARWYNVEVVYEDRITEHYTVSVDRSLPVSSLFTSLEQSEGVHFKIEGKKVTVVK